MLKQWSKKWMGALVLTGFTAMMAQAQCLQGDCQNAWGRFLDDKGRIYEGFFKDGERSGKGAFYYSNGDRYEGEWLSGLPHGSGIRYFADGTLQGGRWEKGQLVEEMTNLRPAAKCLEGDCVNGMGLWEDEQGRKYKGHFKNNLFEGYGEMTYPSGERYKGQWAKGLPNGMGTRYYKNGHFDNGNWVQGKFQNAFRMWVLVVGVADYPNFPKLTYTKNDAEKVYQFYRSPEGGNVPEDQIKVLLDKDATRKNIYKELANISEKADTGDLVVFYFAGHGEEGAFLPYDYNGETKENRLEHSMVTTLLMDSKAKFKLCVADACHSGSFYMSFQEYQENGNKMPDSGSLTRSMGMREKMRIVYQAFEKSKGGLGVIMSSASEEISLEAHKLQQGVFSYCFIQALRGHADTDGDNIVTITELYQFIYDNVRKFTYKFQNPMINDPSINGKFIYDPQMPVGFRFDETKRR